MFLKIINYTIRGLIVVIGILLVSGVLMPRNADGGILRVMGVIFILFGSYRLMMFHSQHKRYFRNDEEQSDE
jgi:hypothetical protein